MFIPMHRLGGCERQLAKGMKVNNRVRVCFILLKNRNNNPAKYGRLYFRKRRKKNAELTSNFDKTVIMRQQRMLNFGL